jgi:hypothetical protein
MKVPALLFLSVAAFCSAQGSPGQATPSEYLTGPYGPKGTWNLYKIVKTPATWADAQALAEKTTDPLGGTNKAGHLATISSGAENMFVYNYIESEAVWIGLTDNEKFKGASEAGSSPNKGWAWVTGEPVTWTNWQTDQPDNGRGNGGEEEDGVAIQRFGGWDDQPIDGGRRYAHSCMIEWDVQSPQPVKGALAIQTILPPRWPAIKELPPQENDSPWLVERIYCPPETPWGRMDELTKGLVENWAQTPHQWISSIHCRLLETITGNGFGWLFRDRVFRGAKTTGFGMLCRAKLRVPKSGIYTFNVHADDGYAIRIGDRRWISSHGQGGIDPQDPRVLYYMLFSPDGDTRGVIDLPAGDYPIEVFYFNVGLDGALQVMTAPGQHPMDGSTDQWRLLGHKPAGKIAWPGIDGAGWKVTIPPVAEDPEKVPQKLADAMSTFAKGKVTEGIEMINFHDPEAANDGRFPGAKPFPDDGPGAQDGRLMVAEGKLVIPSDGIWHIGLRGDDACALQIEDQKWMRTVKDVSGSTAKVGGGDTITVDGRGNMPGDHEVIGEISLTKGTYSIRVLSLDRSGPSVFQVFAAPAGYPGRLLKKNGAVEEEDVPGLEALPFGQP